MDARQQYGDEMFAAGAPLKCLLNNSLVTIRNTLQSSGAIAALNALLSGADTYNGSASADKLRSFGTSSDTLVGGAGIDFAFIDRSTQTRSLTLDLGDPTILSQIGEGSSVVGIERIEFRGGSGNDNLTGGALGDILIGNAGRDWLAGGGGADNLQGGDGPDTLTGDAGTDTLAGGTGIDILDGGDGIDNLDGGANSDWVDGGIGNDTIVGSPGADNLDGNDGTDTVTYAASNVGVTVNLALGTGSGGHAHNDVLSGIENVTGSSFADTLAGDEINNILNGGLGIDTVVYSSATQAVTVNLGATNNQATGTEIGIDQLLSIENVTGGSGHDIITGNTVANTLRGNGGDDVLDGGSGVDTLVGGLGNDRYHLDVAGDQVIEGAGGGSQDRIRASFSYVLPAALDIEFLETTNSAGTAPIDLTGNELQNRIEGNAGSNFLIGGGAFTTVIGDTMVGLGGSDRYFVGLNDQVTEAIGGGSDLVIARQSFNLNAGAEVERLSLQAAFTDDFSLSGNEFDNIIDGNAGDNRLNGGFGRDTMNGLAGDDTYIVDRSNDIVNEAANAGTDRVETSVTYGLLDRGARRGPGDHQRCGKHRDQPRRQRAGQYARRQRRGQYAQRQRRKRPAQRPCRQRHHDRRRRRRHVYRRFLRRRANERGGRRRYRYGDRHRFGWLRLYVDCRQPHRTARDQRRDGVSPGRSDRQRVGQHGSKALTAGT